jgi:hypothetical protein
MLSSCRLHVNPLDSKRPAAYAETWHTPFGKENSPMTESEWLACHDPMQMLYRLGDQLSERKRRLFACACCRAVRPLAQHREYQHALEMAERFANGQATREELRTACLGNEPGHGPGALWFAEAITCLKPRFSNEFLTVPGHAARALRDMTGAEDWSAALRVQAEILRDLTGHLYHPVTINPSALPRQTSLTPRDLAQVIYDDSAFHELPVLADVLEDAGYADAVVLDHCRRPGYHARGCWVVDLLLDKK